MNAGRQFVWGELALIVIAVCLVVALFKGWG
jgi:hypothetical protein